MRSLLKGDVYENEQLAKKTNNVNSYAEAFPVVKEYEIITRSKAKSILNVSYRQGIIFKLLKELEKLGEQINFI